MDFISVKKKTVLYLVSLIFFLGFLYLFKFDLKVFFKIKNIVFLLIAFFFYMLTIFISSLRTNYLLQTIEKKKFNLKKLIKTEFINKFAYYIIPTRINVPIKALALDKFFNLGKTKSLALTSFEFMFDIIIILIIVVSGIFFFTQGLPYFDLNKFILFVIFLSIFLLVLFKLPEKIITKLIRKSEKIKFNILSKFLIISLTFYIKARNTWKNTLKHKKMYNILFLTALNWIASVFIIAFLFKSAEINASLGYILVILAFGIFVSGVSQIPGGLGLRDATMVFLFDIIGYPQGISVAVIIIFRLFTIVPSIIGYLFFTDVIHKILVGKNTATNTQKPN